MAKKLYADSQKSYFKFNPVDEELKQKLFNMDVTQLRQGLLAKEFQSIDLVSYYGERCQKYGFKMGYITEDLYESAFEMAKKCDQERKEAFKNNEQDKLAFFHGIPVSIKEILELEGKVTTIGCAMNNTKSDWNAPCIMPILESGVIPLVRGNVPQSAMIAHTDNYIWGRAKNFFDHDRSCGGSSGGDAGLVAARCVPLGIGSDIASSLRIPAHFNGVYTFKPTQGRLTFMGLRSCRPNHWDHIAAYWAPAVGPIGHSVKDCTELFKIQCHPKSYYYDPMKGSLPFNQNMYDETDPSANKIKVGLIKEMAHLPVCPATKRAMNMTKKALIDEGYEVVDFDLTEMDYEIARDCLLGTVANSFVKYLADDFEKYGERVQWGIQQFQLVIMAGTILRFVIETALKCIGMGRTVKGLKWAKIMTNDEWEQCIIKTIRHRYDISQKWQKAGISALVTPSFPTCSFKAKDAEDMGIMFDYTFIWSILCWPAGIVPITTIQEHEQTYEDGVNDGWTKLLKGTLEGSKGMPITVQVISHSFEDEKALAVMHSIEKQIQFKMKVVDDQE